MADNSKDFIIRFVGDLVPLNKAIGDATGALQKSTKNIMGMSVQVGQAMTGMGAGIVGALGLAVKASAASESAQAQLAAVIKSTGGAAGMTAEELNKMSEALSKSTAFEDDAITAGQSLLLTFTGIGKEVFPQVTQTMLDMSQAMGQDLKSSAMQLGKALNDPVAGVSALSRVGVTFTEQQKEQIKAMSEAGQVADAQRIILAELAKEFGGSAAAAAGTLTGQLTQLKNEFGNLLEVIGNALADGGGMTGLITKIKEVVMAITGWIQTHPELSKWILIIVGSIGALMLVLGPILIMLPGLATAFAAVSAAAPAVGVAFAALAGPIGLAIAAVAALIAIGWALYSNWEEVKNFAARAWEAIVNNVQTNLQQLGYAIGYWMGLIFRLWTDPIGLIQDAWGGLVNFFAWMWDSIAGFFQAGWNFVSGIIDQIANGAARVAGAIGSGFGGAFGGAVPQFAAGGIMPRSGMALVGERGPELVNLPAGARVHNANDTAAMMGGGTTININNPSVRSDADITAIANQVSAAINRSVGTRLNQRGLRPLRS